MARSGADFETTNYSTSAEHSLSSLLVEDWRPEGVREEDWVKTGLLPYHALPLTDACLNEPFGLGQGLFDRTPFL